MEKTTKGIYDAELLANDVAKLVYDQSKAKVCNLLESQLGCGDPDKLHACRRIAEDLIGGVADNAKRMIRDVLGDWEQEVEVEEEAICDPFEKCEKCLNQKSVYCYHCYTMSKDSNSPVNFRKQPY